MTFVFTFFIIIRRRAIIECALVVFFNCVHIYGLAIYMIYYQGQFGLNLTLHVKQSLCHTPITDVVHHKTLFTSGHAKEFVVHECINKLHYKNC